MFFAMYDGVCTILSTSLGSGDSFRDRTVDGASASAFNGSWLEYDLRFGELQGFGLEYDLRFGESLGFL